MCGIAGFYSHSCISKYECEIIVDKTLKSIIHRGPDDQGSWINENNNLILCHTRLSILDLTSNGHQPMHSKDGKYTIVFNGEIYNHISIRNLLKNSGFNIDWRSDSDTETLIESLVNFGIDKTLNLLTGMFSFAFWDSGNDNLYIARDRFGEKPIYWGCQEEKLFFGSELSTISSNPNFKCKINRNALSELVRLNYIPAPYSIFEDISKLLPGHYLQFNLKKSKIEYLLKSYWKASNVTNFEHLPLKLHTIESYINLLDNKLTNVIKDQMISDVPIGSFLSGGIDSSLVSAIMQKNSSSSINTFSIGFNNAKLDEAKFAKSIANHLGTNHSELYINDDDLLNVIHLLPDIFSEPFADSSQIPTYILSNMVSKNVKVALTGDGADELFCGYNHYKYASNIWHLLKKFPLSFRIKISTFLKSFTFNEKFNKLNSLIPSVDELELYRMLVSHWNNSSNVVITNCEKINLNLPNFEINNIISYKEKFMIYDTLTYLTDDILVKVDRASMSNSLETRAPFLDHNLYEFIWQLPFELKYKRNNNKWLLKELLSRYVPKQLFDRPKQGFSVPLGDWLRGPLKDWAEDLLSEKKLKQDNYFDYIIIRKKWNEHIFQNKDHSLKLWSILMFQSWLQKNKSLITN